MNVISGHSQPKGSGEAPASLRWGMELSAGDRDCGKKFIFVMQYPAILVHSWHRR